MAKYEISTVTTITTASVPLAAFRVNTRPAYMVEIQIFNITVPTTSGGVGLVISNAEGTGALTATAVPRGLANSAPTSPCQLVTAWATLAPTFTAANVFKRWYYPVSIGNGIIWTWPESDPLELLADVGTSELVFLNLLSTVTGTHGINITYLD